MIITVCGNHNSGKSIFATSLASSILKKEPKSTIILINMSRDIPAHILWEPSRTLSKMNSIGYLIEEGEINVKTLPKCVTILENNKNIGLIGYCMGDTPLSFSDPDYESYIEIIKSADQLADYVILDCQSNLLSDFLAASIEMADSINFLMTPDLNGLSYFKTFYNMYSSSQKYAQSLKKTNYIFNPVKSFNAVEEMNDAVIEAITKEENLDPKEIKISEIPYSTEIDVCAGEGHIFDIYSKSSRKFRNLVDKNIKNLRRG